MLLFDDQRRRQRDGVAGCADQQPLLPAVEEDRERALAGLTRNRRQLDTADQADVANVDHIRQLAHRVQRVLERLRHRRTAGQQAVVGIGVQCAQRRGAGQRVGRVGVAVEELDQVFRPVHEGVLDELLGKHRAHRHRAVGDALGHAHQVGRDAEMGGRKRRAHTTEPGDDFVEDQQDAVLVANAAQPFQIALGRDQHPGRTRHRLDDHCCDGRRVVQRNQALQIVGQFNAVFGLAFGERVARRIMRVADVVDACQQRAEHLAVGHDAADRDATEVDAVVTALAADQAGACTFASHAVVGNGHLQRGFHRFGTRVRIEHAVDACRRQLDQALRQLEGLRVAHLEWRREVHFAGLFADRVDDLRPRVARIHTPQAGNAVEDLTVLRSPEMHAFGARQQTRRLLELPVGSEGHPVGVEVFVHGGLSRYAPLPVQLEKLCGV